MNNKYICFVFKYKFYNYTLKKEFNQEIYILAKNIDIAEKIFWNKMNGRIVEITEVLYELNKYRPFILKKGRMIWKFTTCTNRYLYLNNKRADKK